MNIVYDGRWIRSRAISGLDRYALELLKHLLRRPSLHTYTVLVASQAMEEYVREGLSDVAHTARFVVVPQPVLSPLEWRNLPTVIRRLQPDLYYSPNVFVHPFSLPIPYVATLHDLVQFANVGWRASSWKGHVFANKYFVSSVLRRFQRLVAISEHTRRDVLRLWPSLDAKVSVVHSGVTPEFFQVTSKADQARMRQKYHLPKHYILYVGRQDPYKNLATLIQAYDLLPEAHKRQYALVLAGNKHPEFFPELMTLVKQRHLGDRVLFPGFIDDADLLALYQAATVYAFPSLYEGFGLPILEAMAAQVPVISSAESSLSEVAVGGAQIVDVRDAVAFGQALDQILSSASLRQQLADQGQQHAHLYSWDITASKVEQLFVSTAQA